LEKAYPVADYIAVNLSSPNTPGLRDLQAADSSARLLELLKSSQEKLATKHGKRVPILFKVAPDLTDEQVTDLAKAFLDGGLDGLIATNTTLDRELVKDHPWANEAGGLSGKPVFEKSNHTLAAFAAAFSRKIPIIGVGGISSKADAEEKYKAGADLVQIYTSFVYQGPKLVRELVL
jgi:dihydroorotate dehydrogenase